jgi:hypothetical protein
MGQTMGQDQYIQRSITYNGQSGYTFLIMQGDGNLVEYYYSGNYQKPCWASGTVEAGVTSLAFYSNWGDLSVMHNARTVWTSGTTDQTTTNTVDMNYLGVVYVGYVPITPECHP